MPTYRVTSPEGKTFEVNAPEGATHEDAIAYIQNSYKPLKPDFETSPMGRFLIGAQGAGEAVGQGLAHVAETVAPESEIGKKAKEYLEFGKKLHEEQTLKNKAANVGTDIAGMAGSLVNPLSAISKNPIVQGAILGATQPSYGDNYALEKVGQAVAGGALGIAGQKVGEYAGKLLPQSNQLLGDSILNAIEAKHNLEQMNLPQSIESEVKANLLKSLRGGVRPDEEALARQMQAEKLGIKLTRGQATREPSLYSQEINLRAAVPSLNKRLVEQENILRKQLSPYSAGVSEPYIAGQKMAEALRGRDIKEQARIGELYKIARESENADLNIPTQKLASDYADILDTYGDAIPSSVRKQFEDYGLLTGKQLKIFTPESADKLEKIISKNYGNDKTTNRALGELKNAIRSSISENIPEGGPYVPAVRAASERFKEHELIPAIPASVEGSVPAEKFVDKFIMKDSADNVKRLAGHLDPQNFEQAKAQIGQYLNESAYGINQAGDATFRPDSFAKALRSIGDEKLSSFFNPDEIDKLKMISNVGSYINKEPAKSSVNRSNTAVSIMQNLPAAKFVTEAIKKTPVVNLIPTAIQHYQASKALAGKIPETALKGMSENQRIALLNALRNAGTTAGGVAGGQSINQ